MRSIVLAILIAAGVPVFGQNEVSAAFAQSYIDEENENYTQAISDLTAVYSEDSYSINLRLGWLYYLNGSYNQSQLHYKNALGLEPGSVEALFGYIYPTSAMGNWDDVLGTYMNILKIDPLNSVAHYRTAYIYFVRKNYSDAETHLADVLRLYPFDFDSNLLMGSVCVKLGKIKEAKSHYQSALEYNPSSEEVEELLKAL